MRKITITQALVELKLYDKKINKAILNDSEFVSDRRISEETIHGKTIREIENNIISDYQSVLDLIRNRTSIKSAIVNSNANTYITIGDVTMTVAEAIEYKTSIQYDKMLLDTLKRQFAKSKEIVELSNLEMEEEIEKRVISVFGSKENVKNTSEKEIEAIENPIRRRKERVLIDPIDIANKIKILDENIDEFEKNVDTVLSVSNAITFIEVE